MFLMKNSPVWEEPNEGGGAAAAADAPAPAPDAASVLYPDDKSAPPAASDDVKTPADATVDAADDNADAGDWAEYVDDPAKTAEENAAAKAANDAKHPVNQVPEDGKYNLTMPDGVEVDQGLLDGLGVTFKELNLSHGNAQALTDKYIETMQAKAAAATKAWGDTVSGWLDSAAKDPEMGGAKWDDTKRSASGVVTRFGTPELKEYLEASGAGNHPEIIRLMAKVGSMIAEDKPAISENPAGNVEGDHAARLYPNDKPKGN